MKNKNILELCLAHGLGGLEMYVSSCYEEFSKKTVCKVVLSPDSKLDNYLNMSDKLYVKRSKFFPFLSAWKLAKYIDKYEIDILHFHWTRDIITAVLAKNMSRRKPKLVQSRHMRMTRFKDDFYHKWLYKNIDMIHAVTKQVQSQLEKFIPQEIRPQIEMVYLGVKEPEINEEQVKLLRKKYHISDDFVVGIIGRIEDAKGQYKVIEAVAKLDTFNIKLLVIGSAMDESYLVELQKKIDLLQIADRVIFTGFTREISEHIQLCDVNILATNNETFGLVVIETMVNKTPIIATNNGGPLEIIEDEVNGVLFDGSSEDLALKIEKLYGDKTVSQSLTEHAYHTVHDKFEYAKQLNKLYVNLQEEY